MAIAAAVPKLKLESSTAGAASSASSVPERLRMRGQHIQMSASAENLTRGGVTVAVGGGGPYEPPKKSSPFPFDSYSGLQEATAQRVKRFEDETARAMLLRSSLQSAAASMQAAADAFVEAAESGDEAAIGAAFRNVGMGCRGCHDNYRVQD